MEEVRKEKEQIQNQFDEAIAALDLHIQSNVAAASQPKQDQQAQQQPQMQQAQQPQQQEGTAGITPDMINLEQVQ